MTPPRSRPRTVCYLAETDAAARDGAAALESVTSGPDRAVQPFSTDETDRLRGWAPEVDCVVFAETPTTAAGAALLEAVEACGPTPLVLFSEAAYAPAAARSTDGIDGYVRRDADDAVVHLADEIEWVRRGVDERENASSDGDDAESTNAAERRYESEEPIAVGPVRSDDPNEPDSSDGPDAPGESDNADESNDRDRVRRELTRLEGEFDRLRAEYDRLEDGRATLAAERDRERAAFASLPDPALRYELVDGRPIVRDISEAFVDVFGLERGAVVGSSVGEGEPVVVPGLEDRAPTLADAVRSSERRPFVSRRETADGVRGFRCVVVPLSIGSDASATADAGDEVNGDDRAKGLVVYADVTDANRRKRELAAAGERLETIAEALDDVRPTLNVARGYLEIAEATGDREHFAEVDDTQARLRDLVDGLVAVARRDAVCVDGEPVALHDVARRAWVAVETGEARLVTREELVLEADRRRLRELFERLFRSAIEAADSDSEDRQGAGDPPFVTVGATEDGFSVIGRRAGVDAPETMPDPGRLAADGTGFGLGPVERIADAHGWDVDVAEDAGGVSVAFRGVESTDLDGWKIERER